MAEACGRINMFNMNNKLLFNNRTFCEY